MSDGIIIGLVILFLILFFTIGPILSIIAINHLFGTGIAINFLNWLAMFWLHCVAASTYNKD